MNESHKTGILVGASPLGAEETFLKECLKTENCITVAADGGLSFFAENKTAPDYWIGDGDSLGEGILKEAKESFRESNFTVLPCEKDDTDMRACMLKFKELAVKYVYLFGGLGGERTDHSIANIQLLHEFSEEGIHAFLISEKEYLFVIKSGETVTYSKDAKGTLSVFSLTDKTEISIRGFHYEFDGVLDNKRAMGVSNEFDKKGGTLRVAKGAALVVRLSHFSSDRNNFRITEFLNP